MKNLLLGVVVLSFALAGPVRSSPHAPKGLVGYVDPFIGTGGHGHTYPGATVPCGMIQ
jgi:putative alpha-1,2-mannosidase